MLKKIIILVLICILCILCIINLKSTVENFDNKDKINIVMSCDKNQFIGLIAIVNSIAVAVAIAISVAIAIAIIYFLVLSNFKTLVLRKQSIHLL